MDQEYAVVMSEEDVDFARNHYPELQADPTHWVVWMYESTIDTGDYKVEIVPGVKTEAGEVIKLSTDGFVLSDEPHPRDFYEYVGYLLVHGFPQEDF